MNLSRALLFASLAAPALARVGNFDEEVARKLAKPVNIFCTFKGNGFPSGNAWFKFNVLARDTDKKDWNVPGQTPNLFVPLVAGVKGKDAVKINLLNRFVDPDCTDGDDGCGNEDFCFLDNDALDREATLCAVDPFPDTDDPCDADDSAGTCEEKASYAIFARTVGKPGSKASAGLCVTIDNSDYCYQGTVDLDIKQKKATDISQNLLTTCICDGIGGTLRVGLFDEICRDTDTGGLEVCDDTSVQLDEQYYWDYITDGVRRAEFRFYNALELEKICCDDPAECTSLDECDCGCGCFGVTRGDACPSDADEVCAV